MWHQNTTPHAVPYSPYTWPLSRAVPFTLLLINTYQHKLCGCMGVPGTEYFHMGFCGQTHNLGLLDMKKTTLGSKPKLHFRNKPQKIQLSTINILVQEPKGDFWLNLFSLVKVGCPLPSDIPWPFFVISPLMPETLKIQPK